MKSHPSFVKVDVGSHTITLYGPSYFVSLETTVHTSFGFKRHYVGYGPVSRERIFICPRIQFCVVSLHLIIPSLGPIFRIW